jgi:D-alanyl-lipoteichoic acid acyltransferase DltB (MBOAT superfamily)
VNVPSYEFLGFAALVALLINVSGAPLWRRWVLLLANVAFVLSFTHDSAQLAPFAGLLALGYAGVKIGESRKFGALCAGFVVSLLLAFCWLKRYAFVPSAAFLPFPYLTVGMSYVFFRIAHLVVDAFSGALPGRVGLVSYLSYTLSFTSLVSGPIQMYADYLRTESEKPASLDAPAVGKALERIVAGLFKVSVLSPLLSYAHDRCVAALSAGLPVSERIVDAALIVGVFPVYLYVNFSGYTDFVIGAARFLRLELPENFNNPFAAKGFIDFWGRWHMTLSGWFKAYVYSPFFLTLIRRFPSPGVQPALGVFVYFATFFLVGLWHGQTTMFLLYGVLQGLGVSLNKLYQIAMTRRLGRTKYRELCANPVYSSLSRGITFAYFAVTLLWFWATWGQLAQYVSLLGAVPVVLSVLLLVGVATVLLAAAESVEAYLRSAGAGLASLFASRYARVACCALLLGITLSVTAVLNAPAPHIVYKAF